MSQFQWDNPAFGRYVPSALENISVHCSLVDCGVFRAASQGRAAGKEMINYCNTIKKSLIPTTTSPHRSFELILQECLSWKVSHQISIWGGKLFPPCLWEDAGWVGRTLWKDSWTGHSNACLCHFPGEWLRVVYLKGKVEENSEQLLSTWCYAWQIG